MPVNKPKGIVKIAIFWLPPAGCMGLIFLASSITGAKIPYLFSFQDIVFHFSIYFLLVFLFCRALRKTFPKIMPVNVILLGVTFGVCYGLLDELHQSFVPQRSVSCLDILIDSVSSVAGSFAHPSFKRLLYLKEGPG